MSRGSKPQAPTDEELMRAYVAGDGEAFQELFTRYAPLVRGLMRMARIGDEDAADLVQQTFLQLHRARLDFREGARLRPWLVTIAYNLRRDYHRRSGRVIGGLDEERLVDAPRQGERIDRMQSVAQLRAALGQLSPQQREVIELHWYAEMPFAEVAQVVGASVSAVKVRAHRAYKQLRAELERQV